MLTVVCWKWRDPIAPTAYTAEHVNVLHRAVQRHYQHPHRFICLTDDPVGIECEALPLWSDHAEVNDPFHASVPRCFRRLKVFARGMRERLGSRIVSVDLDCVVTGDVSPLWSRPEPFVGWRVTNGASPRVYNGSMFLFDADALPEVWETFDPETAASKLKAQGFWCHGNDQAWITYVLGQDRPHWTAEDGVMSFRNDSLRDRLPERARIVFFHGKPKPWQVLDRCGWVREHWV